MRFSRRDFGAGDDGVRQIPLPDGTTTTLSEEAVVDQQIRLARVEPGMRVLEVGCGTGYLCARLCEATGSPHMVYAIDVLPLAVELTRANLRRVGLEEVNLFTGNGLEGIPCNLQFDRIVLSCAVHDIPWRLVAQLSPDGVMVLPLERGWPALFDGVMLSVQRLGKRKAVVPLEMTSALFAFAEGSPPCPSLARPCRHGRGADRDAQ